MTSKELKIKSDELDTLLIDTYLELIKNGEEYSFIRKVLDDEDINDPSEEAMMWELLERDSLYNLPLIEVRNSYSGNVYDAYLLGVDTKGITCLPVNWDDLSTDIQYGIRFYDLLTWSKILLIENMEGL